MAVFFIQALPYGLLSLGGYLLTYDLYYFTYIITARLIICQCFLRLKESK